MKKILIDEMALHIHVYRYKDAREVCTGCRWLKIPAKEETKRRLFEVQLTGFITQTSTWKSCCDVSGIQTLKYFHITYQHSFVYLMQHHVQVAAIFLTHRLSIQTLH